MSNNQYWKQYITTEFDLFVCQYLKNDICDILLIPLYHVTYLFVILCAMASVYILVTDVADYEEEN